MRNGFLSHTAEGALGGALGTLVITGAQRLRRVPVTLAPPASGKDPADRVVQRLEELYGEPLSQEAHNRLVRAFPWAYGVGWGALLGLATARRRLTRPSEALLAGAALGGLVWAVGYGWWLPAQRLAPPIHRQEGRRVLAAIVTHVGFGVLSSLPILLIDRFARRAPWYRRVIG